MIKAFFIAPSLEQAGYWANQWGYKPSEWRYVSSDGERAFQTVCGFFQPDAPAYICGEHGPSSDLWQQLEHRGFVVYDGQDIQ